MTIQWLGHACFKITHKGYSVVIDPYNSDYTAGYPRLKVTADKLLISHEHYGHNYRQGVSLSGKPESACPFTITALVISLLILAVYLLCWILSKKRTGWLTAALVLFCVDTVGLLFLSYIFETSNLLDFLLHAWAIYSLANGVYCAGKLKKSAPRPDAAPYCTGPEIR